MKSMGDGLVLKRKTATPVGCLHYAMTLPTSTVITGIDRLKILKQNLEVLAPFVSFPAKGANGTACMYVGNERKRTLSLLSAQARFSPPSGRPTTTSRRNYEPQFLWTLGTLLINGFRFLDQLIESHLPKGQGLPVPWPDIQNLFHGSQCTPVSASL